MWWIDTVFFARHASLSCLLMTFSTSLFAKAIACEGRLQDSDPLAVRKTILWLLIDISNNTNNLTATSCISYTPTEKFSCRKYFVAKKFSCV